MTDYMDAQPACEKCGSDRWAGTPHICHVFTSLRAANIARQAEWDESAKISLSYLGNAIAGEVGEACNVLKKLERAALGLKGSRATPEQLAKELADVRIYMDLLEARLGIDIDQAIVEKFNETSRKVGFNIFMKERQ